MTTILHMWAEQPDDSKRLRDVGWVCGPEDGWGECDIESPLPVNLQDWIVSFGKLIGSTSKVDACVTDSQLRTELGIRPCPVECLLGWSKRCRRMVDSELRRLRIARMELPTPAELRGTIAKSFCEQIVEIGEARVLWFQRHFVTHTVTSLNLPIEQRLRNEAAQIVGHWDDVVSRWKFGPIDASEWMRLVKLELETLNWPGPVSEIASQTTEKGKPSSCGPVELGTNYGIATRDTWHILEQRFHDIGNRNHNVVLQCVKRDDEKYDYTSHNSPLGNWRCVLIGGPEGTESKPDYFTDHYSVGEFWELLARAGKLLNAQQRRDASDHEGSKRFVALVVKRHLSLAIKELPRDWLVFVNGPKVCAMTAGWLAQAGTASDESNPEDVRTEGMKADEPDARFGDDFRSVWWFGKQYSFTTNQANVVKMLWTAWQRKTPEVSDITLLDASGSDAKRMRDVFRETGNKMNDAWETMIQRGRKDTLKLVEPEIPKIPT